MNPKTFCMVPFCRRWTRRLPEGWHTICGTHWKAIPARLRRRHHAIKRALLKAGEWEPGKLGQPSTDRAWRASGASWRAIEKHLTP